MMLIICRGLPGSGKTYWTREQLDRGVWLSTRGRVARSNRDEFRAMMIDTAYRVPDPVVENAVTIAQHASIEALLRAGITVICDDRNLFPGPMRALRQLAFDCAARPYVKDFLHVPIETCIERDARRSEGRRVGREGIIAMHEEHLAATVALREMP